MAEDKSSSMWNKVDLKSDQPCELSCQFIKQITNDYDQALIVGSGAIGTVYKGICENGEEIAVKVLKNMTGIDNKEFQKEFENLRRLKHENVVQLLGFCNETEKVLVERNGKQVVADKMHTALIFEYVRNGSLANHISADGCSGLNWHIQYKIIKGICKGLEYLRHGLEFPVWHLDLKPANILLDNNMIPKIADFGLSRLLGDENTSKTINPVGTGGYLPPEYIEHGKISGNFDIFSLGVIIAKLMAGREVYFKIDDMGETFFVKHVHDNWRKMLRATLAARPLEVYCEQVRMCIQIAVKCMNRRRMERPTIQSILSDLIETEIMIDNLGLQTEQAYDIGEYDNGERYNGEYNDGESSISSESISTILSSLEMTDQVTELKALESVLLDANAEPTKLSYPFIRYITGNFSQEIGRGGFGVVYLGDIGTGKVAVKKLSIAQGFSDELFVDEIKCLIRTKHPNIVRFLGYCADTHGELVPFNRSYVLAEVPQRLLCFEYVPKGNLQKYLKDTSHKDEWPIRYQMIRGICHGLNYLHDQRIIHLDLKPDNILLDAYMNPKITDFGISRCFDEGVSRIYTVNVRGTKGSIAPETIDSGEITFKSDIYGLGNIIIHLLTGRNKYDFENWHTSFDVDGPQVKICTEIAQSCVAFDQRKRPTICEIMKKLNEIERL